MLELYFPPVEDFNDSTNEFVIISKGGMFRFEHSLKSITKWEKKYCKRFFDDRAKTSTELLDYYIFMCLDRGLTKRHLLENPDLVNKIYEYTRTRHSAVTLNSKGSGEGPPLCSEVLYAYMSLGHVPYECDKWNIENLLNTLSFISFLQDPNKGKPKPMSHKQMVDMAKENDKRLAQMQKGGM